jgi:hypothetical protein
LVPAVRTVELVVDHTARDQVLKIVHDDGQTLVMLE